MGVTAPSEHWYLAEGYTAQAYDTYVLVQNPGSRSADVDLFLLGNGGNHGRVSIEVPPMSRRTVKIDDVPGFEAAEVSTEVVSDSKVIAERAVYFNAGGRDGGHDSVGVTSPSDRWYLAEGPAGDL